MFSVVQPLFLQAHTQFDFVDGDQPGGHFFHDVGQLNDFNMFAQVSHKSLVGLARLGLDIVPPWGFDKTKLGRQWRLGHRHIEESARALARTGAVVTIVTRHDFSELGDVFQVARKDADFIQRGRLVEHAGTRQQATRWLERVNTTKRRRADDRAVGLGAQRHRHHACGDGRSRAAGRAARRVGQIVRVACGARLRGGKFGGHGLAENHRTCCAQARHHGGVAHRIAARMDGTAVLGRKIHGVDDVLDTHRHTKQSAGQMARSAVALQVVRLQVHHTVIAVRKSVDGLVCTIHKTPELGDELLHRFLAAEQVLAHLQSGQIGHIFCRLGHQFVLKKSGLTTDSSLGSRSISTDWSKNTSGK